MKPHEAHGADVEDLGHVIGPGKIKIVHLALTGMFIHCLFVGMTVKTKTQLWGNSLGVRIPAPVARETLLGDGSEVDLQVKNGCIVLTPVKRTLRYSLKKLTDKISARNLPDSDADAWGAPVGREVW